ncbi:MAG: GH25 family lysozyme [Pseudomonadota bacterium]
MSVASRAFAGEFFYPWKDTSRALVLDGYEFNEFDLVEIAKNKRIVGFIHKGSDGFAAAYRCRGNESNRTLCREKWRRYSVGRELYHTRRALAKQLGLKWGAYHLGRPGNPIEQAQHFLQYTKPTDDEIVVIDIENNDPDKWMSLEDAERFARYIHDRLGRWPMLYTNGSTTKFIADNRQDYPILSRLPLWYARFKPDIRGYFPKGNWDTYGIWQFGSHINCSRRSCLYRVKGANDDIDVNVVDMTPDELRTAWPFGQLLPAPTEPEVLLVEADEPTATETAPDPAPVTKSPTDEPPKIELDIEVASLPVPALRPGGVAVLVEEQAEPVQLAAVNAKTERAARAAQFVTIDPGLRRAVQTADALPQRFATHADVLAQFDIAVLLPLATFGNDDEEQPQPLAADAPRRLAFYYLEYAATRYEPGTEPHVHLTLAAMREPIDPPVAIPERFVDPVEIALP